MSSLGEKELLRLEGDQLQAQKDKLVLAAGEAYVMFAAVDAPKRNYPP